MAMMTTFDDLKRLFIETVTSSFYRIRIQFGIFVKNICLVTQITTILKTLNVEGILADRLLRD